MHPIAEWELDDDARDVDFGLSDLEGEELHELLAALRSRHRVAPVISFGQPVWMIVGFDELKSFCRRDDEFPGGASYAMNTEPACGRTFISMEGSEHDLYRQLATPAFRSRPVQVFIDEDLPVLVHEVVDRFAGRGEADLVAQFTGILPFSAISRKLGLPYESEDDQRRWSRDMLAATWDPEGAARAQQEFTEFLEPVVAQHRREPGDDVISHLLASEYKGVRMTDEEVLSHVRLLYATGATTTQDGIGNLLSTLLHRPAILERVRENRELVPAAVHEVLRYEPPVANTPRYATYAGVIGDIAVPAGAHLLQGFAAANRDPAQFDAPDTFDIDRGEETDIITFGFGRKFCPGYHLARRQMATALNVLLDRLPGLRLGDATGSIPRGSVLRGPEKLLVRWDVDSGEPR